MQSDQYEDYMRLAIQQATEAFEADEVPIGAIVVHHNKIIGRGYNQTERLKDATAHAEMIALSAAFNHIGDWRLEDCYLFQLSSHALCAPGRQYCHESKKSSLAPAIQNLGLVVIYSMSPPRKN